MRPVVPGGYLRHLLSVGANRRPPVLLHSLTWLEAFVDSLRAAVEGRDALAARRAEVGLGSLGREAG